MKHGLCLESDALFRSNVTKRSCEKCNPNVALQGFDVLPRGDEDWLRAMCLRDLLCVDQQCCTFVSLLQERCIRFEGV